MSDRLCPRCKGSGTIWTGGPPAKRCFRCRGTGKWTSEAERQSWREQWARDEWARRDRR